MVDLRRVFELCLQVLHHLLNNAAMLYDKTNGYSVLAARLLYVAESVLNWNFGSRLLPKRITCTIEFSPAVCFKPGDTWRELLLDANVVHFFFEVRVFSFPEYLLVRAVTFFLAVLQSQDA